MKFTKNNEISQNFYKKYKLINITFGMRNNLFDQNRY